MFVKIVFREGGQSHPFSQNYFLPLSINAGILMGETQQLAAFVVEDAVKITMYASQGWVSHKPLRFPPWIQSLAASSEIIGNLPVFRLSKHLKSRL